MALLKKADTINKGLLTFYMIPLYFYLIKESSKLRFMRPTLYKIRYVLKTNIEMK